jgi:hypothetical protein
MPLQREAGMASTPKITTGANDRPRNETIGQTGDGFPDDSGQPLEVDPAEVERVRQKLMGSGSQGGSDSGAQREASSGTRDAGGRPAGDAANSANPVAVPAGSPLSAENICRRCAGKGEVDGGPCPDCGGSGVVMTPVGGAG